MLILYITEDGKNQIRLRAEQRTVWLSQREMAELFDVSQDNIGLHLRNIFEDGELSREATTEDSSVVQMEGEREVHRPLTLYNLDAILAVGYRVRSRRGVQFRQPCADGANHRRALCRVRSASQTAGSIGSRSGRRSRSQGAGTETQPPTEILTTMADNESPFNLLDSLRGLRRCCN